jgi:hypothetical protein
MEPGGVDACQMHQPQLDVKRAVGQHSAGLAAKISKPLQSTSPKPAIVTDSANLASGRKGSSGPRPHTRNSSSQCTVLDPKLPRRTSAASRQDRPMSSRPQRAIQVDLSMGRNMGRKTKRAAKARVY